MLMPKRVKRRKQFRGTMAGKALRGNTISNGEYGLVALEPCWIKSNQIEAARVAMTRYIKRGGKVWIKIFPDKPVTAKPAETRMFRMSSPPGNYTGSGAPTDTGCPSCPGNMSPPGRSGSRTAAPGSPPSPSPVTGRQRTEAPPRKPHRPSASPHGSSRWSCRCRV